MSHLDSVPHLLAGALSGVLTAIVCHPLDVLRTRMQVDSGGAYRGTTHAFVTIYRREGWRALYQGFSPSLVGSGMSWGFFMWMYNIIKTQNNTWGVLGTGSWNHLVSAAEAGVLTSILTNPIWLCKTRLELQQRQPSTVVVGTSPPKPPTVPYRGMVDCIRRIAQEEGARALYKGLLPSMMVCPECVCERESVFACVPVCFIV
jgi:solute carrier family 25 folate transporter 32